MTIVMKNVSLTSHYNDGPLTFDFISDKEIKRRFKFYKKDKQGYYYIPEVVQ